MKILNFDEEYCKHILSLECHCVLIDNKYYTTQIYLVPLEDIVFFPEKFYNFFHGTLIYFDNNDEEALQMVYKWTDYLDNHMKNCEIKILACEALINNDRKIINE